MERTDGIPLFVEEMTKAVLEAESDEPCEPLPRFRPRPSPSQQASPRLVDGAARPARCRQGTGADWGSDPGGSFPMHCWLRWCASERRSWDRHSIASSPPVCCSGRAFHPMRVICSSTPSFRTRPTAHCCARSDAHSTLASQKRLKANSLRLPRTSRSYWRVTTLRPG